jgi:tetratricopeptide (TPR) repeat protein
MPWLKQFCACLFLLCTIPVFGISAEQMLQEGRVDEAIASLQQQIKTSPWDADAQNLLCRSYFTLGNWDRAISACAKATSLQPSNSLYHLWLGRAYGEKADGANFFSAASLAGKLRNEFETAVRLSPDSVPAHTDLAEFYLEAPGMVGGGRDKAEDQAKILDKLSPAKAHWVRARIAEKAKEKTIAEKEYRAAIETSQGSSDSWLNLALFYRRVGRLDEMEDAIQHAASASSGESVALVDSAETLVRADRNLPVAVQLLRRYLASKSKVEEAPAFKVHYLLGTVLEKQGDTQGAKGEYSAALALARGFSRAQDALQRVNR